MADTHDTIKGLLAEFRGYAAGMPDSYHVTMSWADFRKMLDRFDAAHKREVQNALDAGGFVEASRKNKQVGNAAKLREAVKLCCSQMCKFCKEKELARSMLNKSVSGVYCHPAECKAFCAASAALAVPPRNCDVGTTKEQLVRYTKFCYAHRSHEKGCGGCPLCGEPCCELAWAQMPYEEGGAK